MTPSTGLGLDGELSAPSSVGVGRHRWAKYTVRVNRQKNAQQPHSLLLQQGTRGHPGRSLDYVGRVVLGRRRVRVDVACSAGGRKEQGRDYPRSAGECRGGSGTGGQRCHYSPGSASCVIVCKYKCMLHCQTGAVHVTFVTVRYVTVLYQQLCERLNVRRGFK